MWANIAVHCCNSFLSTKILAQRVTRYLRPLTTDSLISWTCFIEKINLLCDFIKVQNLSFKMIYNTCYFVSLLILIMLPKTSCGVRI